MPESALLQWYDAHGRHALPWRLTADPYAVWVSEVMLQQTQVATVQARYYAPFLAQFPDVAALAHAPQDAVLKAWEGLGYYRRARHLHAAARQCVDQHGGRVPDTLDALLALPGVGRNTAHAILALGFRQPYPVMEANLKRVLARLQALEHPTEAQLWQAAWQRLEHADPFRYNQAMMDIGALVCTPTTATRTPDCPHCPLAPECAGKADPARYPAPRLRTAVPLRRLIITVLQDAAGYTQALPRSGEFLHGLYRFHETPAEDGPPPAARLLGDVTHVYSHFRLQAQVWHAHVPGNHAGTPGWHAPAALAQLPWSRVELKILAMLATDAVDTAP